MNVSQSSYRISTALTGFIVALVGCVLLLLSFFMSWYVGESIFSNSAFEIGKATDYRYLYFIPIFAIIALIGTFLAIIFKKGWLGVFAEIFGWFGLSMATSYFVHRMALALILKEAPTVTAAIGLTFSNLGIGWYVCIFSGILIIAGGWILSGAFVYAPERRKEPIIEYVPISVQEMPQDVQPKPYMQTRKQSHQSEQSLQPQKPSPSSPPPTPPPPPPPDELEEF